MKLTWFTLAVLCLTQFPQDSASPAEHEGSWDAAWSTGLGRIEVSQTGPRSLSLSVAEPAGNPPRTLELDGLPAGARVRELRVAAFMESGVVLALVVEEGGGHTYRFAATRELTADRTTELVQLRPEGLSGWGISEPIFSDPGAPYRIVDVHNPGSDSLEITFRRGPARLTRERGSELDELIFVDSCPIFPVPLMPGRSELLRVSGPPR